MNIRCDNLVFELPEEWAVVHDGNRLIVHGQRHEELILSAGQVVGNGKHAERTIVTRRVFDNALEAIKRTADDPALRKTRDLSRHITSRGVEYFSISSESIDSKTLFEQAVFPSHSGAVLMTFEAPNSHESSMSIERIMDLAAEVAP